MHPAANRIIDLYERHAVVWDVRRRAGNFPERDWIDAFVRHLPPRGKVLDLGCGSGEPIARRLADAGMRITGVDASPALIGLARARMPDHHWLVGDMRRLSRDTSFDGILAWHSLFHLPADQQREMFAIFAAHSAPGTVLTFNSGHVAGESIGTFEGEPLYHASLDAGEYRALIAGAGFRLIDHILEDAGQGDLTAWLASRQ